MRFLHQDEAKSAAIAVSTRWLTSAPGGIERVLLVSDIFARLRLAIWSSHEASEAALPELQRMLADSCGPWWTGETLQIPGIGEPDRRLWEAAWTDARATEDVRFRVLERHRTRTAWFVDLDEPLWPAPEDGPPLVVFYSFKGGLGRSTTLASFAIQRAGLGERVCVVDFDLDAPGVGALLAADDTGLTSPWGVVDYLLERTHGEVPLEEYYHSCARVAGPGQIIVFPAGKLGLDYADKLARVDLEEAPSNGPSSFSHLLEDIRRQLQPNWILLDARTGVSEPAGRLLSGVAHLHVLFGTTSEQSWQGLEMVVNRLGRQRVLGGQRQAEVLLVHAMVPPTADAARRATEQFAERARREFTDRYFAAEPSDPADERFWDVRDLESEDAPHVPLPLRYDQRLADFRDISEISDLLANTTEYAAVASRIAARFEKEPE